MSRMTRMFVAVVPPEEVVEDLDAFLSARREAASFRWSAAEQWHVTLAFAESVPERALDGLDELLAQAAERRTSFGMRVAGGGAFPHPDAASRRADRNVSRSSTTSSGGTTATNIRVIPRAPGRGRSASS